MAGKRVEVHVTLTNDLSKILNANQSIHLSGDCDFVTALNIATLTLKHRQNKNQKQRIIMFVGSPIRHSVEEMGLVGKKLKKYNIAVDVVSFGNLDENRDHLNQFLKAVNNSNNSSITEVPVGDYIVDNLFSSPIMSELEGYGDIPMDGQAFNQGQSTVNVPTTNQQGVGMSQFERDIDMAIQNSLLEEQRRQEALNGKNNAKTEANAPTIEINQNDKNVEMRPVEDEDDEEAALEQARLLSMKEHEEVVKRETEEEKKVKDELLQNQEFIKDLLQGINSTEIKDDEIEEMMKNIKKDDEDKNEKK
jgi:26S proteasome regulatory subunit N10